MPTEPNFNFHGQSVPVEILVTCTIKDLKDQLLNQLGSSLSSGKLQIRHTVHGFLKDPQSLASLNLGAGTVLEASVKSRGGKR
jgi:hypothetical protein